jgi:hypothetical protein
MVEVDLPFSGHTDRLIYPRAMDVFCNEISFAIILKDDVFIVIDIPRYLAIHVLLYPSSQAIIPIGCIGAIWEVNPY